MSETLCKGCGRAIVPAKNFDTGNTVPLEQVPAAYREVAVDGFAVSIVTQVAEPIFITHRCPADQEIPGVRHIRGD